MFEKFPKIRSTLPKELEDIFSVHYKSNREGQRTASSLSQRMESWVHKQVAKDVSDPNKPKKSTLEIGAGTLNQIQYEPAAQPYDIVEPFTDLYKSSPMLKRIRNFYLDISEVPISYRYDRITSVATLEHICNLPEVIARIGLLLTEKATFRTTAPSDSLLWTLGWKLTTGLEFKLKYHLDYGLIMKHEHVNTAKEIEEVLEYFFRRVACRVLGLSKSISFYCYYECCDPRIERCHDFIKEKIN